MKRNHRIFSYSCFRVTFVSFYLCVYIWRRKKKKKLEITNTAFDEMKLVSLGFRPYLKSDLKTGSNAPLFFFFSLFFLVSFLHWGRFSNGMHRAQCITGGISTTNVAFVSRANNPPCRLPLPAPRDSSAPFTIHTSSGCSYLFPFPMKDPLLVRENVEFDE